MSNDSKNLEEFFEHQAAIKFWAWVKDYPIEASAMCRDGDAFLANGILIVSTKTFSDYRDFLQKGLNNS